MDSRLKISVMILVNTLVLGVSLTLFSGISIAGGERDTEEKSCHHLVMEEPIFKHSGPLLATICGNSCDGLSGTVTGLDGKRVAYEGRFYCFPYVANVNQFLEKGEVEYIGLNDWEVSLTNGPILFPQDFLYRVFQFKEIGGRDLIDQHIEDKTLQRLLTEGGDGYAIRPPKDAKFVAKSADKEGVFVKITDIAPCPAELSPEVSFCASVDVYGQSYLEPNELFAIYCWDCGKLSASPQSLQDSLLFNRGSGLAFDGGYAYPVRYLDAFYSHQRDGQYQSYAQKFHKLSK